MTERINPFSVDSRDEANRHMTHAIFRYAEQRAIGLQTVAVTRLIDDDECWREYRQRHGDA